MVTTAATVPYAYVVEHRPLDACSPPACTLAPGKLVGWSSEVQADGEPGGYVSFGETRSELFMRRARIVRPGREMSFDLSASDAPSQLEAYFANPEAGPFSVEVEITDEAGARVDDRKFEGDTAAYGVADSDAEIARDRYFSHLRFDLPERKGRKLVVHVKNKGEGRLAIGNPAVWKRIERSPRQAFLVIFDGVPHPLLDRMFTGSGDRNTAPVAALIRDTGTYFPNGSSPGLNTPTFLRRFMRNGFYNTVGEPGLFGQGIDESTPERVDSPLAHLAEQGVLVETMSANFLLLPSETRLGLDGGYHNEYQRGPLYHPRAIEKRLDQWLGDHAHDDAFVILWLSITHEPFAEGRAAPPVPMPLPDREISRTIVDSIWGNVLTSFDWLQRVRTRLAAAGPAERFWFLGTDHGRLFTGATLERPYRLPPNILRERDCFHCCLASSEEAATPFAFLYDGVPRPLPPRIEAPTSVLAMWEALESFFRADLNLPHTTTFRPLLSGTPGSPSPALWDDGPVVSVGDSGSIRAFERPLAYRSLNPALQAFPIWTLNRDSQLLVGGTSNRSAPFIAEELYDQATDPFEKVNVAGERPDEVLRFRRQITDWLATYHDPPTHPRFRYDLRFPRPVTLQIEAPREFRYAVDGGEQKSTGGRRVSVTGSSLVIADGDQPVGVISLAGVPGTWLVRCGSSGLPLGETSTRVNLALFRTNCAEPAAVTTSQPDEVTFSAQQIGEGGGLGGGGMSKELLEGLRRWGYVRDIDEHKP